MSGRNRVPKAVRSCRLKQSRSANRVLRELIAKFGRRIGCQVENARTEAVQVITVNQEDSLQEDESNKDHENNNE